jgi:glutamate-1-semialdehyde 2,1-aminomutase
MPTNGTRHHDLIAMTASTTDDRGIAVLDLENLLRLERERYAAARPRSRALAAETGQHWLAGVPLHWMADWGLPFPLFAAEASGNRICDVDGHQYLDACLGDTGAMFGHSPPAITAALERQAKRGLTSMLPSTDAAPVGDRLAARFGLPFWQVTTTASDANRSVLRWARGITGRSKVLVFNGCYHGAVEDAFVSLENGLVVNRSGLVGEVRDLTETTKVVEFNDIAALERALAPRDVACVLTEPVLTNCAMVLPQHGFHEALRRLTRNAGTLLVIDETHTISTSASGYTGTHGLEPDFFVLGKPIAGGVPAAVYGWTAEVNGRIRDLIGRKAAGYSGIGTTLSGSALQLACMRAVLDHLLTDDVYAQATPMAERLEAGISSLIARFGLPWHVVRVGLRLEIVLSERRPCNGTEAGLVAHGPIERALHLLALNRGVLITPFHTMLLVCPATTVADIDHMLSVLQEAFATLAGLTARKELS